MTTNRENNMVGTYSMKSIWLVTAITSLSFATWIFYRCEKQTKNQKQNEKGKALTERDSRRRRPLKFRLQQQVASYISWYGTHLRNEMYGHFKTTTELRLSDLKRAGEGYEFNNSKSKEVLPIPLPKSMHDRFIALWIQSEKVENLLFKCGKAAKDIVLRYFPNGIYWSMPPNDAYHVTLFHFSQYEEPFLSANEEEAMTFETKESSKIWAKAGKFSLVAHDLVLTKSGTLLVLWHSKDGNVDYLRNSFKKHFVNTPVGQTQRILHSTLVRFVACPHDNDQSTTTITSILQDNRTKDIFKRELQTIAAEIIGTQVTIDSLMYAGCERYYDCNRFRRMVGRELLSK